MGNEFANRTHILLDALQPVVHISGMLYHQHRGAGMLSGTLRQLAWFAGLGTTAFLASTASADIDPLSGVDFVTVGAVGNAPWQGNGTPGDRAVGRGSVNYEYRIGKYEVKSNEWAEFFAAALNRPAGDSIPHVVAPFTTGGFANPWAATSGITWRTAAIYCNWLHNGKATNREAFLSGAYDVSTFGFATPFGFSDQRERSPGARYFIPSWDEWLKAAHYDPNKLNGDGSVGGWWVSSNSTDIPLTYGPPPSFGGDGTGMANGGFNLPGFAEIQIPLNSYPTVQTPWGLIDAAGMTSEWTEYVLGAGNSLEARGADGSAWTSSEGVAYISDTIYELGVGEAPDFGRLLTGFRVAAAIPAPPVFALGLGVVIMASRRRRFGGSDEVSGVERSHVQHARSSESSNSGADHR